MASSSSEAREESQLILNNLFKQRRCRNRSAYPALHRAAAGELGLIAMIKLFIEHRIDVIRRRTIFELKKRNSASTCLLGYQIALDHLDNVIRIIRVLEPVDARKNLFKYSANRTSHHGKREVPESRA